jgi:L-histidine N-alpha-methyltransferase
MNFSSRVIKDENKIHISNHLPEIGKDSLVREILNGLCSEPKNISSKYFYNAAGSKLFEDITRLPEYYQTRTEIKLIKEAASRLQLENTDIIEIGSGDCRKISVLLNQLPSESIKTIRYIPIDLSQSALEESTGILSGMYPDLNIHGIVADFIHTEKIIPDGRRRFFCFFGSTIGNYHPSEALKFLNHFNSSMNSGDRLLLGLDRVKDKQYLERAYNDKSNITAKFNKNILNVVNNIAETDFNEDDFDHLAFFNESLNRIEMHLVAKRKVVISSPHLNNVLLIQPDETIHTENSYKFTDADIENFQDHSGLIIEDTVTDDDNWFSLVQFIKH